MRVKLLICLLASLPVFSVQDADSDNDDPVDFVGQDGMFEMTAHPAGGAGQDIELNRGTEGLNITTYGESNLVTEPQKVSWGRELHLCQVTLSLRFFCSLACKLFPGP